MAYSVELSESADRELSKLDPQQSKRILKFLINEWLSWTIHVASEKDCTAQGLESFGNTAWVTTGSSRRSKTTAWSC